MAVGFLLAAVIATISYKTYDSARPLPGRIFSVNIAHFLLDRD